MQLGDIRLKIGMSDSGTNDKIAERVSNEADSIGLKAIGVDVVDDLLNELLSHDLDVVERALLVLLGHEEVESRARQCQLQVCPDESQVATVALESVHANHQVNLLLFYRPLCCRIVRPPLFLARRREVFATTATAYAATALVCSVRSDAQLGRERARRREFGRELRVEVRRCAEERLEFAVDVTLVFTRQCSF